MSPFEPLYLHFLTRCNLSTTDIFTSFTSLDSKMYHFNYPFSNFLNSFAPDSLCCSCLEKPGPSLRPSSLLPYACTHAGEEHWRSSPNLVVYVHGHRPPMGHTQHSPAFLLFPWYAYFPTILVFCYFITHAQKLSGSKQHLFYYLTVHRLEVLLGSAVLQSGSHKAENQDAVQAGSCLEAQGKSPLPSLFRLLAESSSLWL